MTKLIFGCGYLGRRVAQLWRRQKQRVVAVTRHPLEPHWAAEGIEPHPGDVTQPADLGELPRADTVLYAIGYDSSAGPTKRAVYVDGLAAVLDRLPESVDRFLYISSSSVYGQTQAEWVDETSPCEPETESGRICLEAEQLVRQHPRIGPRSIILRLTGLYGPDRVPRREALAQGQPLPVAAEGYLNLIHVDDAADAVLAAERWSSAPEIYLVSDDEPVQRVHYYAEAARLLGGPPPTITLPDPDSPMAERARANKRASNRKVRRQLALELRYPNYRIGLAEILGRGPRSTSR